MTASDEQNNEKKIDFVFGVIRSKNPKENIQKHDKISLNFKKNTKN